MRQALRWWWLALGLLLLVGLALWRPWHRASLAESLELMPVPAGAQAPAGMDDVLVVFYSGDGGWADLDQKVATVFNQRGMPVVGVNMFKYFWRNRPPEQAAADLDGLIGEYLARWHKQRVWLIGYSFGADVLPPLVTGLNAPTRAKLAQLTLLSASLDYNFEIEMEDYMVANWFTTQTRKVTQWLNPIPHYQALPVLVSLDGKPPVACFYGIKDAAQSLCALPGLPRWLAVHPQPGSHHFDENYPAIAARLIDDFKRVAGAAAATPR
jgi:type IV secretory pathway VirJ component